MRSFCGLDFGTSNSTIGIYQDNRCQLVPLDGSKAVIRSAIFCDAEEKEWVFGQDGINRYLNGMPGRLMMAIKTVLGSSLMEDKTVIFNDYIPYTSVLGQFIKHIKSTAEAMTSSELTYAVLGRPVFFHDNDPEKDRLAQGVLEKIAHDVGFKEVSFQYEPIAAALTYETTITSEKLALIVDMGGGTSDFTVIRLHPRLVSVDRSRDVLANSGIHIAGTDFDKRLSLHFVMPLLGLGSMMRGASNDIDVPSSYYHDLTTWHTLSNLYNASTLARVKEISLAAYEKEKLLRLYHLLKMRGGHHVLNMVEMAKQELSSLQDVAIDLSFLESELSVDMSRSCFNEVIHQDLIKIIETIQQTVASSGVNPSDIDAIFYTGGSTKIPVFREKINLLFPNAEVVEGDAFGSVGMGLTIDAKNKFG